MKKRIVSILIAVLLLTGCSVSSNTNARPKGIQIIQMDTSIGGSEDNAIQQAISYHLTLYNG
jgi:uncharacterized lipoprotein YajG